MKTTVAQSRLSQRVSRLVKSTRGSASVEYALILSVVLGLSFVLFEAFTLTPIHHRLITAMSPAEVAEKLHVESVPTDEKVLHDFQLLDDRAFFWQAIAVGLLILLVLKAAWFYVQLRKRRAIYERAIERIDEPVLQRLFEKRQTLYHVISQHTEYLFEGGLEAKHLMSKEVVGLPGSTPVSEVTKCFESSKVDYVVVVDRSGRPLGFVSRHHMEIQAKGALADIMTVSAIKVDSHDKIIPLVTSMLERGIDAVPVYEDEHLVGVINRTDCLLLLQGVLHTLAMLRDDRELSVAFCDAAE